jgi:hypothetical protein
MDHLLRDLLYKNLELLDKETQPIVDKDSGELKLNYSRKFGFHDGLEMFLLLYN